MRQTWRDLLFAHWPIPVSAVRHLVPPQLTIQEYGGTSWLGVVPFDMTGIAPRYLPSLPYLSAFAELNVRLYVEYQGKPGVWFVSLDAANRVAVWGARRFFHLPYYFARIAIDRDKDRLTYRSERIGAGAHFAGSYGPTSDVFESRPGSIEHFLTERYCLYAQSPQGVLYRCEIHHRPWPLQIASAALEVAGLVGAAGLRVEGAPAHLQFARRLDVVIWPLERLS